MDSDGLSCRAEEHFFSDGFEAMEEGQDGGKTNPYGCML